MTPPAAGAGRDRGAFRPDINGLRAWAVAAVVGFHFGVPGFAGGFVGVDVFFVISGFLMTRIIVDGIAGTGGRFSILRFYLARGVRIVPALAVLCAALLAFGAAVMPSQQFAMLCRHVLASIGFFSNLTYWKEAGYFDVASADKWLLHTWSLSVEWQFYLLLPVAFVAAARLGARRRGLAALAVAGLVASFALSVAITPSKPSSAFFLLPTRGWEMLAGGLIHFWSARRSPGPREAALLEFGGIALIVASIALFAPQMAWPGWRAAVPVVGTVMVLVAARPASVWTGTRLAQWVGTNSYSIYLWHWPIVVGLAYFDVQDAPLAVAGGLAATVALGHASFRLVEQRLRHGLERLTVAPRAAVLASAAVIVASSTWVLSQHVASSVPTARVSDEHAMPLSSNGWCFRNVESSADVPLTDRTTPCRLGNRTASVAGLLWGDSFAGQYEPFWDEVGRAAGVRVDAVTTNWCFPTTEDTYLGADESRAWTQCRTDHAYVESHMADYDFVVLAGLWRVVFVRGRQQGVFDAIATASRKAKLVIVMPSPTEFRVNVLSQYERRKALGLPFHADRFLGAADEGARSANDALAAFAARHRNVVFIERSALFNVGGRPSDVTADGVPYSLDGGHISVYGSRRAAETFIGDPAYATLRAKLDAMLRDARRSGDRKTDADPGLRDGESQRSGPGRRVDASAGPGGY